MTLVDRHYTARMLGAFLRVVLSLVLLFIVIDFLADRQEAMSKYDVPLRIVAEYYLTLIPTLLFQYQIAAIAVLIAGLVAIGRAAEHNEITAMLAGGVSLWRAVRGPIAAALVIAAASFLFEEFFGAAITAQSAQLRKQYFSEFSSRNRPGCSWPHLEGGWNCHIVKYNRAAQSGEDVYIHRIAENITEDIRANHIYWDAASGRWIIEDGVWIRIDMAKGWSERVERITQMPAPFGETPADLFALDEPSETKSARELYADIQRAAARGGQVQGQWVDWHTKFARPALVFLMILLAIPFALRMRRGGFAAGAGMGVAIALACLLIYNVGIGLGHLGELPPAVAAWAANILFLAAGVALCRRTPT